MALQSIPFNSRLTLKVQVGTQQGRPVLRSRSFNNIKHTATDEAVHLVGQTLGSLQKYPLVQILRANDEELLEI
ncbi:MAG TPA: DUF1659 domain-containing protein [Dictyoglomaceae bacterium]|nr:DUF1659 domain-containing protein [Dictyoglomaceae bacterium]HOL39378.1 DUF1659 domain-containing protein [Dictyoglomaceae bacterium]HOP95077.1 DUF1659 domain-containing protein [Dictyoglomaceae bacterium]HPP16714.1 DUF1659 domain-containing protein [Dictyoglomaceae bacterium]HPU43726.1 DUF1659 domain-containing protein [Dictyoglomaceae bacterium]